MKQAAFGGDNPHRSPREQLLGPMIDAIAQTMDLYGANYSFGQLYGVMFFEDKPMTLEEMKQVMNMSKKQHELRCPLPNRLPDGNEAAGEA
ncbi:hypothetical protein ACFSQ7_08640 [Paenibacillus rhizoplanae]